ncbi:MAG: tetratricopeptide repeat protein [Planctomycetaceae bacterium]
MRLLLVLAAFMFAAAIAIPARADDPLETYRLAVGFYQKEQWKLAAESFQTFLKENPRHPKAETARFIHALTVVKLEDFRQARDMLRGFVKDYPDSKDAATARYWIGHCSFYLGDYPAAERELAEFLKLAPDDRLREWALPYLADSLLRQEKAEAALKQFRAALEAFPEGALAEDARFGLARSHELLKHTDEALRLYRELAANKQGARAAEAQLNLGGLLFDSGKYGEAAAAYTDLVKRFAGSPQAPLGWLNLGFARYQLGEFAAAREAFAKAVSTEKYAAEATLWQGLCLKAQGDLPGAQALFEAGSEKYRDGPQAEKLLFQLADCEQRLGRLDRGRALFLDVATRWPQGALADEALYRACVAAVDAHDWPAANELIARFDRDFPGNKLRFRQEVLKARVLAGRGDTAGAERTLRSVAAASTIDSTRQQAVYYLTEVLQKDNRNREALEVSEPLALLWTGGRTGPAEFAGILLLRAQSQLALAREAAAAGAGAKEAADAKARCVAALEAAGGFLKIVPDGPQAARALGLSAVAAALRGDKSRALDHLTDLRQRTAESAELDRALYELGTSAFSREDYEWSEELLAEVASHPKSSPWHARALADLGWSQQRRKKFRDAAATFARLIELHPDDALATEAAFMRASALQEAGEIDAAQAAFASASQLPGESNHIYLAGLQSARLLGRLKRVPEADAAYDQLLKRFGRRPDADKVLDEWATLHYNAQDYAKADELFRRLAADYPTSPLAVSARLSLAESDLVAGRFDEARKAFEGLASATGGGEVVQQRALLQLAQVEFETKRWDNLRKVCGQMLSRFPKGTYRRDAEWKWAEAEFYSGSYAEALARLEKLKTEHDDAGVGEAAWFPQVWVLLAETNFRLKRYSAVAGVAQELRAIDGQSPLLYQVDEVVGRSLKAEARWDEAREAFERAIQSPQGRQTSTAAKCQFLIADAYHHEKKYSDALREYLKVDILYRYPEWQAPALHGAGLCFENLGQWKDAARTYEDLLKNFPDSEVAPKARERLAQVRKKLAGE